MDLLQKRGCSSCWGCMLLHFHRLTVKRSCSLQVGVQSSIQVAVSSIEIILFSNSSHLTWLFDITLGVKVKICQYRVGQPKVS